MAKVSFPQKLFALLQDENRDVVSWTDDGRAFRIHDHPTFCTDILPRYFRHSKFSSFQRQLNLYGFTKGHAGSLTGAYHHPHFVRDDPAGAHSIKRAPRKGEDEDDEERRSSSTVKGGANHWGTNPHLSTSSANSAGSGGVRARTSSNPVASAAAKAMRFMFKPPPKPPSQSQTSGNPSGLATVDFGAGLAPKKPLQQPQVAPPRVPVSGGTVVDQVNEQQQQQQQALLQLQHLHQQAGKAASAKDADDAVVVGRANSLDDNDWIRELLSSVVSPREGSQEQSSRGVSLGSIESFGQNSEAYFRQDTSLLEDDSGSGGLNLADFDFSIQHLQESCGGGSQDRGDAAGSSSSMATSSTNPSFPGEGVPVNGVATAMASFVGAPHGPAMSSFASGPAAAPLSATATVAPLPVRHWTDTEATDVPSAVAAIETPSPSPPATPAAAAAAVRRGELRERAESERSVDSEGLGHAHKRERTSRLFASALQMLPTSALLAAAWLSSPKAAGPDVLTGALRQVDALNGVPGLVGGAGSSSSSADPAAARSNGMRDDDEFGELGELAEELIAKHGAKKALVMSLALLGRTVPASAAAGPPPAAGAGAGNETSSSSTTLASAAPPPPFVAPLPFVAAKPLAPLENPMALFEHDGAPAVSSGLLL